MGSCNTLSNRVCVPNKTEDLNSNKELNLITERNESKTLTKNKSHPCKWQFGDRKCNLNQKRNNDKCRCECKNPKEHNV